MKQLGKKVSVCLKCQLQLAFGETKICLSSETQNLNMMFTTALTIIGHFSREPSAPEHGSI